MKPLAIILTCALIGVMGWLVLDSRSDAKGARNQLDLIRRQQGGGASAATPADEKELAALEKQLMTEQMNRKTGAGSTALPAPGVPALTVPPPTPAGSSPAVTAALQAAAAAPPPMTPRQRQIMAAPAIAEVKHYAKDYGFVEITSGAARKIEKGMGFAIRRGNAIIGRVKVTEVEDASAVADLDPRSLPAGVIIEVGDEVIQDLPPEA